MRFLFGGTPADITTMRTGRVIPNSQGTAWFEREGADSPATDLTDLAGNPTIFVTSDDQGMTLFYGPDDYDLDLWLDFGLGYRTLVRPVNPRKIAPLQVGTVGVGDAALALTGNAFDGYLLNMTLPAVGDESIGSDALIPGATGDFDVRSYDAVGDGVADDTAALTAAVAAAKAVNGRLLVPSDVTLRLTSQVDMRGDYEVDVRGRLIIDQTSTPGILVGHISTTSMSRPIRLRRVSHTVASTTVPAVRVMGLKGGDVTVGESDYLQLFADGSVAAETSIAYSRFVLGTVNTLHLFGQNGTAWINENTFEGGRMFTILIEGSYGHNHNIFYHPKIEGSTSSITISRGSSNHFVGVRAEGSPAVVLSSDTYNNHVTQSYSTTRFALFGTTLSVSDEGTNNFVQTSATMAVRHVPLLGINPGACPAVANSQTPALGFAGLTLGSFTDTGTAVTASANRRLIDTGLIPLRRDVPLWDLDGLRVLAVRGTSDTAWMRVTVVGYDSAGTQITTEWDAGGNSITWNATNGHWTIGSSDRNYWEFQPIDQAVAYLRIIVNSGSAPSFTRFGLEAIVSAGSMVADLAAVTRRMTANDVTHPSTDDVLVRQWDAGKARWQTSRYDSGWRDISSLLVNSWTGAVDARRINGEVQLRFRALDGSAASSDTVLTLPAGFRPDGTRHILVAANTTDATVARVAVTSAGVLTATPRASVVSSAGFAIEAAGSPPSSLPGTLITAAPA